MHHQSTWPWRIPLRRKDHSIRAWTLVDEEDFAWASELRWFGQATPKGDLYAARFLPRNEQGKYPLEQLHRRILGLVHGDGIHSDHRNHDTLDNRRANLRAGTRAENMQNKRGRGYSWRKMNWCWEVKIMVNGKNYYGGSYRTEAEAAAAARALYAEHNPFKHFPD